MAKLKQTVESNGLCTFANLMGWYPYLEVMKAITGWEVDVDELLETGHRIQTLRQMFNAREGALSHDIPQRIIGSPPLEKGPTKGNSLNLEPIAQDYYEALGYEKNGVPKQETLKQLDLEFAIADLEIASGVRQPLVNEYLESQK
jgi:aldehyde:ferredoxin oxidoreductase